MTTADLFRWEELVKYSNMQPTVVAKLVRLLRFWFWKWIQATLYHAAFKSYQSYSKTFCTVVIDVKDPKGESE